MRNKILLLLVAALILGALGYFLLGTNAHFGVENQRSVTPTQAQTNTIQYNGLAGKDALSLLKEKANVEISSSGLVSAINGRKADDSKHEYWAFYVNGKLASVGPAQYKTAGSDIILWKIETY